MTALADADLQERVVWDGELVIVEEKHLSGQHDQSAHAGGRGFGQETTLRKQTGLLKANHGREVKVKANELPGLMESIRENQIVQNLSVVNVEGEPNLYNKHLTDLKREQMPQLPVTVEGLKGFDEHVRSKGIKSTVEEVDPRDLVATQAELNSLKVAGIAKAMEDGTMRDDGVLVVSREGAVLDGHHRWAAAAAVATKRKVRVKVVRYDADIKTLLALANGYEGTTHENLLQSIKKALDTYVYKADEQPPPPPDATQPWFWTGSKWELVWLDDDMPRRMVFDTPVPYVEEEEAEKAAKTPPPLSSGALALLAEEAMKQVIPQISGGVTQTTMDTISRAIANARRDGTGSPGVLTQIAHLFSPERAKRIAVTETTRVFGAGSQAVYRARGITHWQWKTVQDPWVCMECSARSGQVYKTTRDFEPAHVNCRCFPAPVNKGDELDQYNNQYDAEHGDDYWKQTVDTPWEERGTARDVLNKWAAQNGIKLDVDEAALLHPGGEDLVKAIQFSHGIADGRYALRIAGLDPNAVSFQITWPGYHFGNAAAYTDAQRTPYAPKVIIILDSKVFGPGGQAALDTTAATGWHRAGRQPSDIIVHEIGHAGHALYAPEKYVKYSEWTDLPRSLESLLGDKTLSQVVTSVGIYASRNPVEFVAEVFEGLASGVKYSDEVMALYKLIGGPPIEAVE